MENQPFIPALFFKPSDITIFGIIRRPRKKGFIIGKDGHGLDAFPGGKVDPHHQTLLDALEEELTDEIGATLNFNNFGDPAFNLNCLLAHHTPLTFCTATTRSEDGNKRKDVQKLARKPLKLANTLAAKRHNGEKTEVMDIKLRVIVPLYEISGNKLKEKDELTKLAYRNLSHKSRRKTRESVRITLSKTMDGRWDNLKMPNPEWPWKLNTRFLQNQWLKMGVDPEIIERFTGPIPSPLPQMQHQPTMMYQMTA